MQIKKILEYSPIYLTLFLVGIFSFQQSNMLWGINHLQFLPQYFSIGFFALILLSIIISLIPENKIESKGFFEKINDISGKKALLYKLSGIVLLGIIFWLSRIETFFLGDGYTWLNNFALKDIVIHKWTEPISGYIIRFTQSLLGDYNKETSLLSFQIISILSGCIVFYNLLSIIQELSSDANKRFLYFSTLCFSGTILLFLGYVEFYPLFWASVLLYFNYSLKYLNLKTNILTVTFLLLLAISIHLQAIYLLFGYIWIISHKNKNGIFDRHKKTIILFSVLTFIVSIGFYAWLYNYSFQFKSIFLPIFGDNKSFYSIFSLMHLNDIINLLLLICPSVFALIIYLLLNKWEFKNDSKFIFLIFSSIGSLLFLFLIDPILGLGRDWDLMSFTLFPFILIILYSFNFIKNRLSIKFILLISILSFSITVLFLATNLNIKSSEDRIYSILNHYKNKDRNGWVILTHYYQNNNNTFKEKQIIEEINNHFPLYHMHLKGFNLLNSGNIKEAHQIADFLYQKDSTNSDYLNLLGHVYAESGNMDFALKYIKNAFDNKPDDPALLLSLAQVYNAMGNYIEATNCLKLARKLNPKKKDIIAHLGLAYLHQNFTSKALAYCDTLFSIDKNSPNGLLLKMMLSIKTKDTTEAKLNFEKYKIHGQKRSEYKQIISQYKFLEEL
ncbi:MAG: tetratricopeptide repeat protein [candidate division Zixibacteria bacterium]|nr:tetratricopeptide repeat protein [candidate division Zixibacteria bacterium]